MADAEDFWTSFQHDPRDPAVASMRASDADRDIVLRALGEAYADGRLDREEFDERVARVTGAKTLGELPALLVDLVLPTPPARPGTQLQRATRDELRERAERKVAERRRQAWWGALSWSLICWFIWFWPGDADSFPWPIFVTVFAVGAALRASYDIEGKTTEELRRLERKALEKSKKTQEKELESGED